MRWLCAVALVAAPAAAQGYDQSVLNVLMDRGGAVPETPVAYRTWRLEHPTGNSVLARHALYETVGEGDAQRGRERLAVSQLLGQSAAGDLRIGDALVLPARPADFDLSPLAYAPYPGAWPGAVPIAKAVVVDLPTQTWAAYANGLLVRWGPVSTGKAATPTPTGRFTMTWRAMERESSEAPPGQTWLMRYVMNIHVTRGIHLHQYDHVPTGPPEGLGCIRLVTADARWLWDWSESARTVTRNGRSTTRPGTLVIVQGETPTTTPVRFVDGPSGPERVMISLPADPMAVPRGDR